VKVLVAALVAFAGGFILGTQWLRLLDLLV
jgi:hypothetical protein